MAEVVFMKVVSPGLPGLLSVLRFDATISESPTFSSSVTEHPVESGSSIADHVMHSNTSVALEVVVTNTPLAARANTDEAVEVGRLVGFQTPFSVNGQTSKQLTTAQIVGGFVSPYRFPGSPRQYQTPTSTAGTWTTIPDGVGGSSLQFPTYLDRVTVIHSELMDIKQKAHICQVFGKNTIYEDMILTSLTSSTEAKDSLTISLVFTSARFVEVGKAVGVKLTPLETRAKPTVATGTAAQTPIVPRVGVAPAQAGEGAVRRGSQALADAFYGTGSRPAPAEL